MHIGPLPPALQGIRDDARSNRELLDALEKRHVALFARHHFERDSEPIPQPGTQYNFLATVASELPFEARANANRAFEVAANAHSCLQKPSLRSALFLMERMARERLWADVFVMSESIDDHGDPVFVTMGYEHDDGVPWITSVPVNHVFSSDCEVILLLAQA
jgi:hypothetical protein